MEEQYFAAIDLGAGSGRVILGKFGKDEFHFEVVHRFPNGFKKAYGKLRWDTRRLFDEIKEGLKKIARREIPLKSIGVDTWGVDYGLFDEKRKLIQEPVCYRDLRTEGIPKEVFSLISPEKLFKITGIQFLPFNTIFQIYAEKKSGEWPENAKYLQMMPDIFNFYLTGEFSGEYTMATTSQLVNAKTGNWDESLCDLLQIDPSVLPELRHPGDKIGNLNYQLQVELNLPPVDVMAVASHDTGSAVAGTPLRQNRAYISSGTWSLVGIEVMEPIINKASLQLQMTNEGGAYGSIRFLKNVMGMWLLESCRKVWQKQNKVMDYDELIERIKKSPENHHYIFPDDLRYLNPRNMVEEIKNALDLPELDEVEIGKIIFESLALRYREVIEDIQSITGNKINGIRIIGGGCQNDYLNQATANATGLRVTAGPVEATAIGNLLVQAISAGRFSDLKEGRQYLDEKLESRVFEPNDTGLWNQKFEDYKKIISRGKNKADKA